MAESKEQLKSLLMKVKDKSEKKVLVAQLCPTLCDPMDCRLPGSSGQEYWSGLPLHSPRDLPDPGIEPVSPVSPALHVILYLLSHGEEQSACSNLQL